MFLLPLLQCTAPNVLGDSFSSESATCQVLSGIAFVIGLVSGFSTVDIFIVGKRRNKSSELTIFLAIIEILLYSSLLSLLD